MTDAEIGRIGDDFFHEEWKRRFEDEPETEEEARLKEEGLRYWHHE